MNKKLIFLIITFTTISSLSFSQVKKRCVIEEIEKQKRQQNPTRIDKKIDFERVVAAKLSELNNRNARVGEEIIRIPVVVHVIHDNADGRIGGLTNKNIMDDQIYSQIKVLNEDYRRKIDTKGFNTDPVGSDTGIEFFLATYDPDGKPTTGIVRVYHPQSEYDIIDDREFLSSLSYWDSNKYLNIWVTAFKDDYLGYGEFPGGAGIDGLESEDAYEKTDGIFVDYSVFGREIGTNTSGLYRFGRTTTHEVGHWLGLIHTWGDEFCGTDYVSDTPQITGSFNGSTCRNVFSTCEGTRVRNMIENYMDYSPDECMNIFTVEQSKRIRAILEISKRRKRMVNYAKFQLPPSDKLNVNIRPNPASTKDFKVQVLLPDFQDFNIELYDNLGRKVHEESFKDLPSTVVTLKTQSIQAGIYYLNVYSKSEKVMKRVVLY